MALEDDSQFRETPWHALGSTSEVFERLHTNLDGLTSGEAAERLQRYGAVVGGLASAWGVRRQPHGTHSTPALQPMHVAKAAGIAEELVGARASSCDRSCAAGRRAPVTSRTFSVSPPP